MKYTAATAAVLVGLASSAPAAKDCPAPGTRDSQGRYSCNPAHQYPEGQICDFVDGCPFLRQPGPGVTASAPASSASSAAPKSSSSSFLICNAAAIARGDCTATTANVPTAAPAPPAPAPPANKPGQYGSYGSYPAAGSYANYGSYKDAKLPSNYGSYGSYGSYGGHPQPQPQPPQAPQPSASKPAAQPSASKPAASPTKPAAPPAGTPTATPAAVYGIKGFTERRLNGTQNPPNTVFFNVTATNSGTLNFECAPYNPATNSNFETFTNGTVYSCGQNSQFSFAYDDGVNGQNNTLFLWQGVTPENTIGGSVSFADPICRAGGSGPNDFVCSYPDGLVPDLTISLRNLSL